MGSLRRVKWHPPPPPTPRILHFPHRTHLRRTTSRRPRPRPVPDPFRTGPGRKRPDLEAVVLKEEVLNSDGVRERAGDDVEEREGDDVEERESDRWRFEAEMLRGECKLLRMEREIAVKRLEKERGLLDNTLNSAVPTLLSGKKKMKEGKNGHLVIQEEIEELAKKLMEFQRNSRMNKDTCKVIKCTNFDKQASLLKKHLQKLGDIEDVNQISKSDSSARDSTKEDGRIGSDRRSNRLVDVETLRRKMEGLSNGKLLKRMEEEYGSMLSVTAPNSSSTSRIFDLPEFSSFSFLQSSQEAKLGDSCSGQCKAIVRRIMEQVRAETEQWSQMQEMLGQVKGEMEELQASRDFWEERARVSDNRTRALQSEVDEWKGKARSLESKENQLQKQVVDLQHELERLKVVKSCDSEVKANKDSISISLGAQLAREKRLMSCRLKERRVTTENHHQDLMNCGYEKKEINKNGNRVLISSDRVPFKDIGNVPSLKRQNSRRYVYPLHS